MDSKNVKGGIIINKEMKIKAEIITCQEDWERLYKAEKSIEKVQRLNWISQEIYQTLTWFLKFCETPKDDKKKKLLDICLVFMASFGSDLQFKLNLSRSFDNMCVN